MASVEIRYIKNAPQSEFHNDLKSKILMLSGGLGSGKSYALIMKMLQLSWVNRGYAGGLLAPSYPEYKRDLLPIIKEILVDHNLWTRTLYNQTDKTFVFPWTDKPLYVFTADKPIAGPNLAYCGINEFSLMQEDRVNEMLRRVRVKDAALLQRCMAGTPEDSHGWLEEFVEKQVESGRLRIINAKTTDNPHLDEDYIEHLRQTLDPQAFKLFAEGMMIKLGGNQFYYAFSQKNVTEIDRLDGKTVYANVDFNVGRMTATFANIYHEHGRKKVLIFDEVVLTEHSSDTYAIAEAIKTRFGTDNVLITCDASGRYRQSGGSSDVKILEAFGFDVRYKSSNPRLRKRQLLVNGLLSHEDILINKRCKETILDFKKVLQDPKDFTKVKADEKRTHASDTIDYLVSFEFKIDEKDQFVRRKIF